VDRYSSRIRVFAACLSGLAGFTDASGFTLSGGFFVSFMSGNSTRLGVGIIESAAQAVTASSLIVSFVIGVAAGSVLGHKMRRARSAAVLGTIGILLLLSAGFGSLHILPAALVLMAIAMGMENAIFEQDGQVRVGLTYMTGSLVKIGQAIAGIFLGRSSSGLSGFILLWTCFVAGAVAGAATTARLGLGAIWFSAAAAFLLALVSGRIMRDADS
jgi:uncharacterized membrane protein YoaK (UPF0700 family)